MKIAVIGGGFYGTVISLYLKEINNLNEVHLFEKKDIVQRSSLNNQARVHNGYHYPRSFSTAFRSHYNFQKFIKKWPNCIVSDFDKFYGISKSNSKTNAKQFIRFCNQIEVPYEKISKEKNKLFNSLLIEDIFKVKEYAFDVKKLKQSIFQDLINKNIKINFSSEIINIKKSENKKINLVSKEGERLKIYDSFSYVFNCTYSNLTKIDNSFYESSPILKHELTEIVLINPTLEFRKIRFTLLDGPLSLMPFPTICHSLSHVRYTPHYSWIDNKDINPYEELEKYDKSDTRFSRIIRDVQRYIPNFANSEYLNSIFEIKTILLKNEFDDGRPILFRESSKINGLFSVLGSKIDNIFEVLEAINEAIFEK